MLCSRLHSMNVLTEGRWVGGTRDISYRSDRGVMTHPSFYTPLRTLWIETGDIRRHFSLATLCYQDFPLFVDRSEIRNLERQISKCSVSTWDVRSGVTEVWGESRNVLQRPATTDLQCNPISKTSTASTSTSLLSLPLPRHHRECRLAVI